MTVTVKVEGLRELEQAMKDLTKAAGSGVLRRSLKKAAEPMAAIASAKAPRLTGQLSKVEISTKLTKRQAAAHRKMFRDDRAAVEMFLGPAAVEGKTGPVSNPAAHTQEFGTVNHGPQPFMRPAWDSDHKALLERLSGIMRVEIDKAILRAQRKAERLRVKG